MYAAAYTSPASLTPPAVNLSAAPRSVVSRPQQEARGYDSRITELGARPNIRPYWIKKLNFMNRAINVRDNVHHWKVMVPRASWLSRKEADIT